MRKILAAFMLLACLVGNVWATFGGEPIPRPIPFTDGGKTYTAYVRTYHPYYNETRICYYSSNYDQAYAPVLAKSGVIYGGLVNIRVLLNPASFGQAWDGSSYNDSEVLCAIWYGGNWYSVPTTPTSVHYLQLGWNDANYDLTSDYVLHAVGINVKVNETYNFNDQFYLTSLTSGDVVATGAAAPSYLSFPLAGVNAYTAEVSSVMDQGTLGTGSTYGSERNGTVSIFNGESGTAATGCYCYSTSAACNSSTYSSCAVPGYLRVGGGSWTFTGIINYSGSYVYYDGHPGYDYPKAQSTAILSPAAGTLCVAIDTPTSKPTPSAVWRNTTNCGSIPSVVTERWQTSGGYNAFYILHGSMLMNGSTDEYMTVFLHSNNLESTVLAGIYDDGYKTVTRLQEIAAVGNISPNTIGYHVHMEVYKKVSGTWNRVDPYGDGTSNLLWPKPY